MIVPVLSYQFVKAISYWKFIHILSNINDDFPPGMSLSEVLENFRELIQRRTTIYHRREDLSRIF
jgi:hypothetical protein